MLTTRRPFLNSWYSICLLWTCCLLCPQHLSSQNAEARDTLPYIEGAFRAKQLIKNHQYEAALEVVRKTKNGLQQDETSLFMLSGLMDMEGRAYFRLGDLTRSLSLFEQVLQLKRKFFKGEHYTMTGNYGNVGDVLMGMGRYQESLPYFEKMLEINQDIPMMPLVAKERKAYALGKIGDYHAYSRNYEEALDYYLRSQEVIQNFLDDKLDLVSEVSMSLSRIYREIGDFPKAFQLAEKAIAVLENEQTYKREYAKALQILSRCYRDIADYEREHLLLLQAVAIYRKTYGDDDYYLYRPYNELGLNAKYREEYKEAIPFFERARNILTKHRNYHHPSLITLLGNLASVYSSAGVVDSSEYLNLQAIELSRAIADSITFSMETTIFIIHNLGINYQQSAQYVRAQSYFNEASERAEGIYGDKHPSTAITYISKAFNLTYLGQFQAAEQTFLSALNALDYKEGSSLAKVNSLPTLVTTLARMGRLYFVWFKSKGQIQKLRKAQAYFQLSEEVLSYYAKRYKPLSKFAFVTMARETYVGLMRGRLELYKVTDSLSYKVAALNAVEATRSSLLYNAMRTSEALTTAEIPTNIVEQERELRMKMTYWEKQKYGEIGLGFANVNLQGLTDTLLRLNETYQQLQEKLEIDYPAYYAARFGQEQVGVQQIQKELLAADQCLVEYLLTDSILYIFVVQKDSLAIEEVRHNGVIEDLVQQLTVEGIYGYHAKSQDRRSGELEEESMINYTEAATRLYQLLWAPIEHLVSKRVLVIPDQALAYVPFETLLQNKPARYGKMPLYDFLIRDHSFSYGYSAALLLKMKQQNHQAIVREPFFGMAPFSDLKGTESLTSKDTEQTRWVYSDTLSALPFSKVEIQQINRFFQGDILSGTEATLDRFSDLASNYRIIHLSTHAKADQRNGNFAFLAFKDEQAPASFVKLFARDLYNMKIPADLVTLSACETGLGRLRYGEGVISLARGFTYAGAKSIVNTLWSVDDASIANLMVYFYQQLKEGIPKDLALQRAKLKFLDQEQIPMEKRIPFFWAAPILIGDTAVLN